MCVPGKKVFISDFFRQQPKKSASEQSCTLAEMKEWDVVKDHGDVNKGGHTKEHAIEPVEVCEVDFQLRLVSH